MPELELHVAKVIGRTLQGEEVKTTGFSGNQHGLHYRMYQMSRRERAHAMLFSNYLERLSSDNQGRGGGKTAFTCAEPHAILKALMRGARLDTIRVTHIHCGKDSRRPCSAFCGQYLRRMGNGWYRLDMDALFPPRRPRYLPRPPKTSPLGKGWFVVNDQRRQRIPDDEYEE